LLATVGLGGAMTLTAIVPFVASLLPSERAKAAGAPVEVDIDKMRTGRNDGR
jgi:ubiquinol-cytochrome c reductase iron-sulfur subunit